MRSLLVINAILDGGTRQAIAAGRSPRRDYLELQRALGADVIDLGILQRYGWTRLLRRVAGAGIAQTMLAWVRSFRYDTVFVDRETTGFLLAALLKLRWHRPRLVMLGHFLSPTRKQALFRTLRLHTVVDRMVVHSSLQADIARSRLRLAPEQVVMIPYHSDTLFWTPVDVPLKNQICSAGLEFRDHDTLIEAVRDLDIDVVIAAASHWSKHRTVDRDHLPPRVRIASYDYAALRELYAESLFVVVPLHDVDNQAGITTILEAMAMGKAVIVSHSHGQIDVVRDRRARNRTDPARPTQPEWTRRLGVEESIARGQTGIYVMPGDSGELKRAITFLLSEPNEARSMATNGRRMVEAAMSLDHYTQRLAALVVGEQPFPAGREPSPLPSEA